MTTARQSDSPSPRVPIRNAWTNGAIIAGLVLFALHPIEPIRPLIASVGVLLMISSLFGVRSLTTLAAVTVGALCLYAAAFRHWFIWPAYLLVPIMFMMCAAFVSNSMNELREISAKGRVGKGEIFLILGISVVSGVALAGWVWYLAPDLTRFRVMIPVWPIWALAGAGIIFSVINAILEELIWRGVLQSWLLQISSIPIALFVQALSFGAAHYMGFPGGIIGVGLATFYGLMLGALALYSRGLLAAIVAHVAADAVIFTLVIVWTS